MGRYPGERSAVVAYPHTGKLPEHAAAVLHPIPPPKGIFPLKENDSLSKQVLDAYNSVRSRISKRIFLAQYRSRGRIRVYIFYRLTGSAKSVLIMLLAFSLSHFLGPMATISARTGSDIIRSFMDI